MNSDVTVVETINAAVATVMAMLAQILVELKAIEKNTRPKK